MKKKKKKNPLYQRAQFKTECAAHTYVRTAKSRSRAKVGKDKSVTRIDNRLSPCELGSINFQSRFLRAKSKSPRGIGRDAPFSLSLSLSRVYVCMYTEERFAPAGGVAVLYSLAVARVLIDLHLSLRDGGREREVRWLSRGECVKMARRSVLFFYHARV